MKYLNPFFALLSLILLLGSPSAAGEESAPPDAPRRDRRILLERFRSAKNSTERRAILGQLSAMSKRTAASTRKVDASTPPRTRVERSEPAAILARHTYLFGIHLDEIGLARNLRGHLVNNPQTVEGVFDRLSAANRDDVAFWISSRTSNERLRETSRTPAGLRLLRRIGKILNSGLVTDAEATETLRIVRAVSPTHGGLAVDTLPPGVDRILSLAGASHQPIRKGSGSIHFDDYSVRIDRMPVGLTPERFLTEMASDLNGTIDDPGFDAVNYFHRRPPSIHPRPGEIIDIDILGPDNGSVVLREIRSDHFLFSTIKTPQTGSHPEYGNRNFGFERNTDGSITFFTRGVSRPSNPGVRLVGAAPQNVSWSRTMRGISDAIEARGGSVRPDSFRVRKGF